MPQELSSLALGNREALYKLLFQAAWQALARTMQEQHGIEPAALMVLHTWNQKLEHHAHVHAVVAGSGPGTQGQRWVACRRPGDASGESVGHYLVDAERLRTAYRTAFLKGLDRLYQTGELKLGGKFTLYRNRDAWQSWLGELESVTWVSFIQGPPAHAGGPADIVRYLSGYLTGGPISDRRIVAADGKQVTFLARQGTTPGGAGPRFPSHVAGRVHPPLEPAHSARGFYQSPSFRWLVQPPLRRVHRTLRHHDGGSQHAP